eukprot:gene176-4422_t
MNQLPNLKIFEYLDSYSLTKCFFVCKLWFEKLELDQIISQHLWKKQCESLNIKGNNEEDLNYKILYFEYKIMKDMKESEDYFKNEFEKNIEETSLVFQILSYLFHLETLLLKSFPYVQSTTKIQNYSKLIKINSKKLIKIKLKRDNQAFYPFLFYFFKLSLEEKNHPILKLFYKEYLFELKCLDNLNFYIRKHFSSIIQYNQKEENEKFIIFISAIFPESGNILKLMLNEFYAMSSENENLTLKLDKFNLNVKLLSKSIWPMSTSYCYFNDNYLLNSMKQFQNQFENKFNGKSLSFQYNFGTSVLKLHGFGKRYEIYCSTFQMSILLLFNENDKFTTKEIKELTNIKDDFELKKQISPLLESQLLLSNSVGGSTTIAVNSDFVSSELKISVFPQ